MKSMSISILYATLVTLASATSHTLDTRSNNINITAFSELPTCAIDCGTRILAAFNCLPTDPCFCETKGPQVEALAACLTASCTIEGALASQRLQAQTCDFPIRNIGPRIAIVSYVLFGVAMVFVIARFVSRIPRLHGAGLGRDDWIVAFCVPAMAVMTVVAYYENYYGSGRDVWNVPMEDLEPFALVSTFTLCASTCLMRR